MSAPPSASADRAVCDGLTRHPAVCLATGRGERAGYVRPTSASHDSSTSTRASLRSRHLFEACASPLRPRACAQEDGDRGTWRFKTPDPLRWAVSGCRAAFILPLAPDTRRTSGTPVAAPWTPPRLSRGEAAEAAKIVHHRRSVKIRLLRRSGVPSIASLPRRARIALPLDGGHVMLSAVMGAPGPLRPRRRTLVREARG